MKRGDKFKVVGKTEGGTAIIERTLDDGAKVKSLCITRAEAEGRDDVPTDAELVTAEYKGGEYHVQAAEAYKGPSRASSKAYRSGWDNIFGKPKRNSEVN